MFVLPQTGEPVLLVPAPGGAACRGAPATSSRSRRGTRPTTPSRASRRSRVRSRARRHRRPDVGPVRARAPAGASRRPQFIAAREVTASLRIVKDADEIDGVATCRARRRRRSRARCERSRSPAAARSTCTASSSSGCSKPVTSGRTSPSSLPAANAASPHHEPSVRVIDDGDVVLCDFGGTMAGYCSDITRMFVVGEPEPEVRDAYAVLVEAQEAGVRGRGRRQTVRGRRRRGASGDRRRAGTATISCTAPATASAPRPTRTRTSSPATTSRSAPGMRSASSPGIYLPGRFGLRLEDIVVATDAGPERLNHAPRDLAIVG